MIMRGAVFALLGFCVSSAWAQTSPGRAAPLIVGQWKLNPEKSHLHLDRQ